MKSACNRNKSTGQSGNRNPATKPTVQKPVIAVKNIFQSLDEDDEDEDGFTTVKNSICTNGMNSLRGLPNEDKSASANLNLHRSKPVSKTPNKKQNKNQEKIKPFVAMGIPAPWAKPLTEYEIRRNRWMEDTDF